MYEKLIIKNGIVVTIDKDFRIIEDGSIVIQGNRIIAIGETKDIEKEHKGDTVIDAKGKAVLPGLVNLHYHSHTLTRGVADRLLQDVPSEKFIVDFYYPLIEAMKPADVYAGASLGYVEAVKTGTTCLNDIYRHPIALADAAKDVGVRAVIASEAADLIKGETLKDNEKAFLEKHNSANGRIKIWFGVEWVTVCSPEFLVKARELANKYKTGIHTHLNESLGEVEGCKKKYGKRPTEHMYDLGVLGEDCVASECVWLNDKEIGILKETGTHVAYCPAYNMKGGNGIARVPDIISAGINVGLGTDGFFNSLDMFESMRHGTFVQRAVKLDRSLVPFDQVLKMATINGAKALGMEKEIGSIEPGKKADLILIDLKSIKFEPLLLGKYSNLIPNLTYAANGSDVETVLIDGKIVMENREMKTVDEEKVIEQARRSALSLLDKVL